MGDHTETIAIDFDPQATTYEALLTLFWKSHNAAAAHRSVQYAHAIFYQNDQQAEQARASLKAHAAERAIAPASVTTQIRPLNHFTYAEKYHQKYRLSRRGDIRKYLEQTYPGTKDFADSTIATRLNAFVER